MQCMHMHVYIYIIVIMAVRILAVFGCGGINKPITQIQYMAASTAKSSNCCPHHCTNKKNTRRVTSDENQTRHFGFLCVLRASFNIVPPLHCDDGRSMNRARPSEDDIERMKGREKS